MSTTIVTVGGVSRLVHPADVPALGCIEIDIPWSSDRGGGQIQRGADRHYPPLRPYEAIETIIRCPLWKPDREGGCHLWLWITNLCHAARDHLIVLDALGFREVSMRTWHKERMRPGIGRYMRGETEHVILATTGPARVPAPMKDPPTTHISAPIGRHSEKPPGNRRDIERISPGPRAEIFARAPREGWYSWGNDAALAGATGIASNPAAIDATLGCLKGQATALRLSGGAPPMEMHGHLPGCELGMGDGEEVWTCEPGCPDTRVGLDLVRHTDGRVEEAR